MNPIKKIVILGGGTAGWTTAAVLSSQLHSELCQIELIESNECVTIGVGESTIPPFVRFIQNLGISETDFITSTEACYKLGIKFNDWRQKGDSFFHPFGTVGRHFGLHSFYQCWRKAIENGRDYALLDFSPNAAMAAAGRFFPPQKLRASPLGGGNYAITMDALRVTAYFREFAKQRGVKQIEGHVTQARQRDNGFIDSLLLRSGQVVEGDFFVDCTGFNALLIGQTLGSPFEDWSHFLPCDRAVTVRSEINTSPAPFTTMTAQKAGWTWRVPLKNAVGNGYVYSSHFCSDQEAKSLLLRNLDSLRINEAQVIPFTPGRRREVWRNNCLSVGLASGFIEPLESTAIHLITRGLDFFLRFFPDRHCDPALIKEYNRRMSLDFEEVRDFVVLHYYGTQRRDTPFWEHCQASTIPDSLSDRLELFKAHGHLRQGVDDLFGESSWITLLEGMGIRANNYCPRLDNVDFAEVDHYLSGMRSAIQESVHSLPRYEDYIQRDMV
jgi:tryptophan halogenase